VSGEAARKKIGILDINGKNFRYERSIGFCHGTLLGRLTCDAFRLHPVPLSNVRTFVTKDLSLREHRDALDPEDPKVDQKVAKVLEEEVRLLILHAREKSADLRRDALASGNDAGEEDSAIKYKLLNPAQVLIRIRVEHMGFPTLNNQRFGAKFVGDVANPSDILLFHRKKDPKLASTVKKNAIQPMAPEELERTNMEDLVREQLAVPESKLQLFGEKALSDALEDYVDKSVTVAIADTALDMLSKAQKELIVRRQGPKPLENDSMQDETLEHSVADVSVSIDLSVPSNKKRKAGETNEQGSTIIDVGDSDDELSHNKKLNSKTTKVARSRTKAPDSSEDDFAAPIPAKTTGGRPAKRAATTKRKVVYTLDESDDDEVLSDDNFDNTNNGDEDDDDVFVEDQPPSKRKPAPKRNTKPKTAPKRATTTSGTARKTAAKKPSRRAPADSDDDENVDEAADLDVDWGSAATRTQRGAWS
jgi:double-strand break repair protein MRE11